MADESPLDRFKSVLTGASRAIAHEPEVEVAWTADAAVANGKNFRVPMPGRNLPRAQAMEARGFADAMALKLKHHDEALHARHAPSEPSARACYDAVEAVRYEALGANAYAGMRENLDAATMVRLGGDPITRASRPDEVPLQAALGLLLREHLTGQPVPESARAGADMLRGWIGDRAGKDFDALALTLDDQQAFQKLTLDMLQHLELTRADPMESDTEEGDEQDQEQHPDQVDRLARPLRDQRRKPVKHDACRQYVGPSKMLRGNCRVRSQLRGGCASGGRKKRRSQLNGSRQQHAHGKRQHRRPERTSTPHRGNKKGSGLGVGRHRRMLKGEKQG